MSATVVGAVDPMTDPMAPPDYVIRAALDGLDLVACKMERRWGYYSTWPRIVPEFSDLVGQEPPRLKRPPPSPAAISRMEETLEWPKLLKPQEARIVWERAAAHEHWLYGLCVLAWKPNGRHVMARRSKRHVIAMVRGKAKSRGPLYPQLRS